MKEVCGKKELEDYSKKFPLTDFFSFDMEPYTSLVRFESGEVIMREGERPDRLYYMLEGRAKLFLSHANGRITLINFLDAPCFVGEMELIGAQETTNGVTAVTTCTCYEIRVEECRRRLLEDTGFLRYLCVFLGRKALENTDNYSRNQAYPLETRLARFILTTAHNGVYTERHTEAAEFLGVSYRHLLYVLAGFVEKGLLSKSKRGYEIADPEKLREMAWS